MSTLYKVVVEPMQEHISEKPNFCRDFANKDKAIRYMEELADVLDLSLSCDYHHAGGIGFDYRAYILDVEA
jgi:hypothetical protein